jgi:hypothetical protein
MKTFFKTLGGLIVLGVIIGAIVAYIGWSRVPDMVSERLSQKMKVAVKIDDISLGLNAITIDKLDIGNPRSSILPRAFFCNKITSVAPIMSYLKDAIVIEELHLDQIYLGLEFDSPKGTSGNWTRIMGNLNASMPKEASPNKRTVLIKKVILTNISTELVYRQGGSGIRRLPTIDRMELTNISSEGDFPMDQITNSVLGEMLKQVFIKQNLQNMLQDLFKNGVPTSPSQAIETFKGLFGL